MNRRYRLTRISAAISKLVAGAFLALTVTGNISYAQQNAILEEIIVTATKRTENIQDVPISIATISGRKLDSQFASGESVLALAYAVPGLYAESSNGRGAPRFYMRGLGNADFDQGASQPVSIIMDDVVMELVALKSFPLFDLEQVEVIRGPQGTLFGRNTTAGIIKFDSRRPTEEVEGYAKLAIASRGTLNFEGAIGGSLVDNKLSARLSVLSQNREDWVDNGFTGDANIMGGMHENAARLQLLFTPTDDFSALLLFQGRDLTANTASLFRANVHTKGSNELNSNYNRAWVAYNGGGNNPQTAEGSGITLKLDWDIENITITSITSSQDYKYFARGDIDGGVAGQGPGFILFDSDTGGNNDIEQLTQEFRIASDTSTTFRWQAGLFYFDDRLITTTEFGVDPTSLVVGSIAKHENEAWAVFGQGVYDFNDEWSLTAGLRYTEDDKIYTPVQAPPSQNPINLNDDNVSWDLTLTWAMSDASRVYGRVASGFRAPSIQARNAAFGDPVTTANSETIVSGEIGWKAEFSDRARLNTAIFYYTIDDMQLTAIGGGGNFTTLLNAKEGEASGIEVDLEIAATENLILSGGFGYNDTSINDSTLSVGGCNTTSAIFDRICTITDPLNANGDPIIDGNPFQHVPEWTLNLELDYVYPLSGGGDLFFYTDWKFKGKTNEFLYESIEYFNDSQFEGGLRTGWHSADGNLEVAFFGRNITDEANSIGGIDFVNLTSYVNQPRFWGVEGTVSF